LAGVVIDPFTVVFFVVIAVCVPAAAYMIPQDPTVVRLVSAVDRWRRHRQLRRWIDRERQSQR
jgi:hypothetical protein